MYGFFLVDPKRPIQDVTKDLVGSSISVKVIKRLQLPFELPIRLWYYTMQSYKHMLVLDQNADQCYF